MRSAPTRLVRTVELRDPLVALRALAGWPHAFLFRSTSRDNPSERWYFGADPFATFGPDRYDEAITLWRRNLAPEPGGRQAGRAPFTGGLVGAWSYDFGRRLERLPERALNDLGWPDVWLAAYDVVGAWEPEAGVARLFSSGLPAAGAEGARRAERRLDEFARRLEAAPERAPELQPTSGALLEARSTFTPDRYRSAVERVREHIGRGDIFQANLSQRWTIVSRGLLGHASSLFAELRRQSPAPHAAYLDLGDFAAVSASPERFLRVSRGRVETRPIKGTRPRGADAASDAALASSLLASAKDRAENVMIVDVLRNDLGRACRTGSVVVDELCALESFPQVHHLTSTISGQLAAGRDAIDLLHACFPGGSITGAPKIRAMEIIEALEPVRRHLYTGAIGWLDWNGDADWNIAIRTALLSRDRIDFAAGGGITADSDPDAEYLETLHKAEGMRLSLAALLGPVALAHEEVRA